MASVGQDGELHALGASVLEQRLDRGADRPAGVEDVVDEDAGHPLEGEVERRRADEGLGAPRSRAAANVDVVAVKGDVELSERDLAPTEVGDAAAQPLRQRDSARVDADERDALELGVALDDLVGDARQRALDCLDVEDRRRCRGSRGYGALRAMLNLRLLSGLTGPS